MITDFFATKKRKEEDKTKTKTKKKKKEEKEEHKKVMMMMKNQWHKRTGKSCSSTRGSLQAVRGPCGIERSGILMPPM